jgi:hypothetical protein
MVTPLAWLGLPRLAVFLSAYTLPTRGETGDQTTSEATYTGYARVAVARSSGGWTISGTAPTQVQNAALISFPACTAGSNTITFFGVGTLTSGAGKLLYSGAVSPNLAVSNGITPQISANGITITED